MQKHSHIIGRVVSGQAGSNRYTIGVASDTSTTETRESGTGESGNLQPYQVTSFVIKH